MGGRASRTRKRGVALSSEAVALVEAALDEAWRRSGRLEKLTWERRALLLGLGEATTKRLLQGKPVDRATIDIAFAHLGRWWLQGQPVRRRFRGSDTTCR